MSGDSTVTLGVSTAIFSQNTAARKGGGLFISAGEADFDPSNGAGFDLAKVTFWRLDLVDNSSPTGDGGGVSVRVVALRVMCHLEFTLGLPDTHVMRTVQTGTAMAGLCAYSLVNLLPGGHTNATGNSAARGGAAALVDTTLIVQPGHLLTAQHNQAHRNGGALALLEGGTLALLEEAACSTQCSSSSRATGSCSPACMSSSCNWDGGDCVRQRMETAGKEAAQVCERGDSDAVTMPQTNATKCRIFDQTSAAQNSLGCEANCFTAACDWSRQLCVEPRANVQACELIDAAAYASIKTAQRCCLAPMLLCDVSM